MTKELVSNPYFWLRIFTAVQCIACAVLIVWKNARRWKRNSDRPLRYGERLWREGMIALFAALAVAFVQSAVRNQPGVQSSIYVPSILLIVVWGLWKDLQEVRKHWAEEDANPHPRRRFYD